MSFKEEDVISDEEIVELFWQRNEQAIKETDAKYGKFLFRIAYNILHDTSDSEECQNDTYLAVWNAIPPNKPSAYSVFIAKIMRNNALDKYKQRTRKCRVPSEMTVSMEDLENSLQCNTTPETELSAKELSELINRYLDGLSDRQNCIFVGRFYMGDTFDVIASKLKIHVSTVHREAERIKKGLKEFLERNGVYV